MLCNTVSWAFGPLGHPLTVFVLAASLGDFDTLPATGTLLPLQTFNLAFWTYLYWEGLRLNVRSSARAHRSPGEMIAIVIGVPLLTLLECLAVVKGLIEMLRGVTPAFTVIAKPR